MGESDNFGTAQNTATARYNIQYMYRHDTCTQQHSISYKVFLSTIYFAIGRPKVSNP